MAATRFGFVGAGQMATALARGLIHAGLVRESDLFASDPVPAARELFSKALPQATFCQTNVELAEQTEVIVLAVKPQQMSSVGSELRGHMDRKLVISVIAGMTTQSLGEQLQATRIVRVMPNTPCLVGAGAAGIARGPGASDEDQQFVLKIMNAVGVAHSVSEELLDAVTGLSGSGPAFVAMFIEALSDGGVRMGLPRAVASELAAQTVFGAAQMILQTGRHPAQLKDQVASPGGTTIAGIQALEERGFRGAVMAAVEAATLQAKALGK